MYVYLDGIWLKRSWGGEVRNVAVLVAIGVTGEGYREILGVVEGTKEDMEGWRDFLRHLKGRGLQGVRLIISECLRGLVRALRSSTPRPPGSAAWCIGIATSSATCPEEGEGDGGDAQGDPCRGGHAAARQKASSGREVGVMRLAKAAQLVAWRGGDAIILGFPREHWTRIRTNNVLERIMREIRRRTRVVGAFPDGQSAVMLVAARLRHIAGTAWSTKRYLNIELLKEQQMRGAIPA